jgi:Bacterial protein of unknown function (HtrL_YibB)
VPVHDPARLTLVSALFDIGGRERNPRRRSAADYLEVADFVLGLDCDLVLFADPEVATELQARRDSAGLADRTRVVVVELERLPAHRLLPEITAARSSNPIENANPDKDTPLYTVLLWSKTELLRRAVELDPFAATHFAWIDLGLAARPHPADRVFETPSDRIRLLQMRGFDEREIADPRSYYSLFRGHLAAGYICGSREAIVALAALIERETAVILDQGIAPSEEQLVPALALARPELFEFHFGDYAAMLANYVQTRESAPNLLFQLRDARVRDHSAHGELVCDAVLEGLAANVFEADPATLAAILEECYLVAYYRDAPERLEARTIATMFFELVRVEPDARDVFLRDEVRMRENFGFVGEPS